MGYAGGFEAEVTSPTVESAARDVNKLEGSEMFKLNFAFSMQMRHWSSRADQNFPLLGCDLRHFSSSV